MSEIKYHYVDGNRKSVGPVGEQDLAVKILTGEIRKSTPVWHEGLSRWTPCGKLPQFQPHFSAAAAVGDRAAVPPVPSPVAQGAVQPGYGTAPSPADGGPIWNPLSAFVYCMQNYANFSGRATRDEYWNMVLGYYIAMSAYMLIVLLVMSQSMTAGLFLSAAGNLAVCLPCLACMVRRLHDIGKSGAHVFFMLIPLVGGILMFIWLLTGSDVQPNAFGMPEQPPQGTTAFTNNRTVAVLLGIGTLIALIVIDIVVAGMLTAQAAEGIQEQMLRGMRTNSYYYNY